MFRKTVDFYRHSKKTENQVYSVDFRLIQNLACLYIHDVEVGTTTSPSLSFPCPILLVML